MSNNDAEVDSKIAEGPFPYRTRVWNNSKFTLLGISSIVPKAAAMVANALISVEAIKKMNPIIGDGTVLDLNKLSKRINQYLNKYLQELNHQNEMIFK
jgi:hypothetical protein